MAKYNIISITCDAKKENFIKLFNILNNGDLLLSDSNFKVNPFVFEGFDISKDIKNIISLVQDNLQYNLKDNYINWKVDKNVPIILNVNFYDDIEKNFEISDLKYLLLLNHKILKKNQGYLNLRCESSKVYSKYSSFIFPEALDKNCNIYISIIDSKENKVYEIAKKVSISKQWAMPMYISPNDIDIYNFLSGFLFKEQLKKNSNELLQDWKDRKNHSVRFIVQDDSIINNLKNYYRKMVLSIYNLLDVESREYCVTKFFNMPTLALIILALKIYALQNGKKTKINREMIELLINNSYDYCESILQMVENIISHSDGGYIILRTNNNVRKLKQKYDIKQLKSKWHLDISIIDHSSKSIVDNIENKYNVCNVYLEDIFKDVSENEGYANIMNKSENVIHHYGLRVFTNIVNEYKGNFKIISSQSTVVDKSDKKAYMNFESEYVKTKNSVIIDHIPGTDCEIMVPFSTPSTIISERKKKYKPYIPINPIYKDEFTRENVLFEDAVSCVFEEKIKEYSDKFSQLTYQQRKEKTIEKVAEDLKNQIQTKVKENQNYKIIYFALNNLGVQIPNRIEVIAKIILKLIFLLGSEFNLDYLLYGIPNEYMGIFVRQFSLFYKRKLGCEFMRNTQLYVVSSDYNVEILFAGENLETILDYTKIATLNNGVPSSIIKLLDHIVGTRTEKDNLKNIKNIMPLNFDFLPRIEAIEENEEKVKYLLSPNKKWYYKKLENVLLEDIHNENLGCCLKNTHVRINQIHLDRFYEAQLLFGNSYWCNVFSSYLMNITLLDKKLCESKNCPILIVGYETYSEPMLFSFKNKMSEKKFKDVSYVVFENEKYITPKEKSKPRMRYFSKFVEKHSIEELKETKIIFISAVSSTLSLMDNCLNVELQREFNKILEDDFYNQLYKKGIVVIQVYDENDSIKDDDEKFIKIVSNNCNDTYEEEYDKVISDKYLNFLDNKECHFLISVPAVWSDPNTCPKCFPNDYRNESILIETNETSTVPMLLIQSNEKKKRKFGYIQDKTYESEFLENFDNHKYLYYSHIDRGGNHYQYYFKTANLVYDLLTNDNKQFNDWFKTIKLKEDVRYDTDTINIIVCPAHFSNETFASAVNKHVFDGKAYIINFDVKKEFRQTFEANYANYKTAIDVIKQNSLNNLKLNFYYVDDQIITGETFNRSKSLIRSLLNEHSYCDKDKKYEVNLFKAIIVVINRNSISTVCNYFDLYQLSDEDLKDNSDNLIKLPYYRFMDFNTPSLRSYGDSCPICSKVNKADVMIKEAALTVSSNHWINKKNKYELKTLQSAKEEERESIKELEDILEIENAKAKCMLDSYIYRGFRKLKCSEDIWKKIKVYDYSEINTIDKVFKNLIKQLYDSYLIDSKNDDDKIEYLISFIKVISRPFISYREIINSAVLNFLLNVYSVIIYAFNEQSNNINNNRDFSSIYKLIKNDEISAIKKYDLFRIVISCLCFLGSCWLINTERLIECYHVGEKLEKMALEEFKKLNKVHNGNFNENLYEESFEVYLCLQIKKSFYVTRDTKIKMIKFDSLLENKLNELFKEGKNE